MADYDTLLYEEKNGVAWVTLNRPDVHNAFNARMQQELRNVWRSLRRNDDVRCIVLTGAGDKAFTTGIDRTDRKSTRLNSSHANNSYAVFCLKKKPRVRDRLLPRRS